ncbi:MAG: HEAT repeat domain-containing protein [Synergistetes bacterium]|nr:HEAT repeat domain-containing protein [Synergistota bacterium]
MQIEDLTPYYKALGLRVGASLDEVKRAFRRLALRYHPDIAGEELHEKYEEIVKAYHFLTRKVSLRRPKVEKNEKKKKLSRQAKEILCRLEKRVKRREWRIPLSLLLDRLKSDNIYLRREVAKHLSMRDEEKALEALVDLLKDDDNEIVKISLRALEKARFKPALSRVRDLIVDGKGPEIRWMAVEALVRIGGEEVLNLLLPLLKHPVTEVRLVAVRALGLLGDRRAACSLTSLLYVEQDAQVRTWIKRILENWRLK